MRSPTRTRSLMVIAAALVGLADAGPCRAQAGKDSKPVTFKTNDGVELSGTLYPKPGGKKDAVVLLIPNFSLSKGGGIQQEGWEDLAKALQKDGYAVLGFDFRGFGDSKAVDPQVFWKAPHNGPTNVRRRVVAGKFPEKIDHKDFHASYLPYLVNDVAAAKAFLDRENDRKNCNTSNLIVIGAGNGATLGAMWLVHECRRRKDKSPALGLGVPMLGDSEGKSVAGAVWLSVTPSLGARAVPLQRWIIEAGRTNKIPMAFIYGKDDATSANVARGLNKAIKGNGKSKDFDLTGAQSIADAGKLAGHLLLQQTLDTQSWIINKYLGPVMEKRTTKEWVERKVGDSRYFYTSVNGGPPFRLNKPAGVEVPPVDVNLFLSR